jgi:hypothetical protein
MTPANQREQIAHHEAAHAVLAIRAGVGVSGGIDLDAPTSVDGAFGQAAVNLLVLDDSLPVNEQRLDLARNLSIICAGAASDARITGAKPLEALEAQPGDYSLALQHARSSSVVESEEEAKHVVTEVGLSHAVKEVARAEVWAAIKRIATAVIASGGQLGKDQVTTLGTIVSE